MKGLIRLPPDAPPNSTPASARDSPWSAICWRWRCSAGAGRLRPDGLPRRRASVNVGRPDAARPAGGGQRGARWQRRRQSGAGGSGVDTPAPGSGGGTRRHRRPPSSDGATRRRAARAARPPPDAPARRRGAVRRGGAPAPAPTSVSPASVWTGSAAPAPAPWPATPATAGHGRPVPAGGRRIRSRRRVRARAGGHDCGRDGTCDGQGACRRYPGRHPVRSRQLHRRHRAGRPQLRRQRHLHAGQHAQLRPQRLHGGLLRHPLHRRQRSARPGSSARAAPARCKRPAGQTCTAAGECASGQCVDGVCCSTACGMPCFACNLAGALGTCTAVPAGQDPGQRLPRRCRAASCQRDGTCNGRGGCRLHAADRGVRAGRLHGRQRHARPPVQRPGRLPGGGRRRLQRRSSAAPPPARPPAWADADCQAGLQCRDGPLPAVGPGAALEVRRAEGTVAEDASGNDLRGTYTGVTGTPAPSTSRCPPPAFANPAQPGVRAGQPAGRAAADMAPMALKPVARADRRRVLPGHPAGRRRRRDRNGSEVVSLGDNYLLRVRDTDIEVSKRVGGSEAGCAASACVTGHLDGSGTTSPR